MASSGFAVGQHVAPYSSAVPRPPFAAWPPQEASLFPRSPRPAFAVRSPDGDQMFSPSSASISTGEKHKLTRDQPLSAVFCLLEVATLGSRQGAVGNRSSVPVGWPLSSSVSSRPAVYGSKAVYKQYSCFSKMLRIQATSRIDEEITPPNALTITSLLR